MSVVGYFEGIIDTWKGLEKRTPTVVRDMKEVLRQFQTSLQCGEIPEDKQKYLKDTFYEISREVYK